MKITENILRKIIRKSLKEARWFNSNDYDFQASDFEPKKFSADMISSRVIFFNDLNRYNVEGMTHGLDSHALKHLIEFGENSVRQLAIQIIEFLSTQQGLKLFALDKGKPYEEKYPIKIQDIKPGDIINTLDRISDNLILQIPVLDIEKYIYNTFFIPTVEKYDNLTDTVIENAVDLNDTDYPTTKDILDFFNNSNNPIIKFQGYYTVQGSQPVLVTYYYNYKDTTLISQNNDKDVVTTMRTIKFPQGIPFEIDLVSSLSKFLPGYPGGTKFAGDSGYQNLIDAVVQLKQQKQDTEAAAKKAKEDAAAARKAEGRLAREEKIQSFPPKVFPWKQLTGQVKGMYRGGKGAPVAVILARINNRIKIESLNKGINYQAKTKTELEDWMAIEGIL